MSRRVYQDHPSTRWRVLRAESGFGALLSSLFLVLVFGVGAFIRFHPELSQAATLSDPKVVAPSPPDLEPLRSLLDLRSEEPDDLRPPASWLERLRDREARLHKSEDLPAPVVPPSHPLGTDPSGRDLLLGILAASTLYPGPGLLVAVLALGLGALLGGLSTCGHHPRRRALLRMVDDTLATLPRFFILMFFLSFFRVDIWTLALPVGILTAVRVSRALSGRLQFLSRMDFLDSARELGLSEGRILWKHLLKANCRGLLVGQAALAFADFILIEATMGYLGLGIEGEIRGWGTLISEGTRNAYLSTGVFWVAAFPVLLLVAVLSALQILAGLAERLFDPVVRT